MWPPFRHHIIENSFHRAKPCSTIVGLTELSFSLKYLITFSYVMSEIDKVALFQKHEKK